MQTIDIPRDPQKLDQKIRQDIERRIQELDAEKEKWLQILRVLNNEESQATENKSFTYESRPLERSEMTNIELVEAAMESL